MSRDSRPIDYSTGHFEQLAKRPFDTRKAIVIAATMFVVGVLATASPGGATVEEQGTMRGMGLIIALLSAIPMRYLRWRLLLYIPFVFVAHIVASISMDPYI